MAELAWVETNGHHLALMIRGHDTTNPVLLYLAGGPGGSEMGSVRNHLPGLEEHFTVVTWEQRGSRMSYPELDRIDPISVQGYVDDTIAVTDYLRERYGQDRISLLGQSWGSTQASWRSSNTRSAITPSSVRVRWSASARPTASSIGTRSRRPGRTATIASKSAALSARIR